MGPAEISKVRQSNLVLLRVRPPPPAPTAWAPMGLPPNKAEAWMNP